MNNRMKIVTAVFATIGFASTAMFLSTSAFAQEKSEREEPEATVKAQAPVPVSKVTPVQAMKAAEAKVGGHAKMAIFEFDEGHWVYGVVLVKDQKLVEVDVDPVTGKAGNSESVTPDDEAKEFRQALAGMLKD